jgi:hypothetical protein
MHEEINNRQLSQYSYGSDRGISVPGRGRGTASRPTLGPTQSPIQWGESNWSVKLITRLHFWQSLIMHLPPFPCAFIEWCLIKQRAYVLNSGYACYNSAENIFYFPVSCIEPKD